MKEGVKVGEDMAVFKSFLRSMMRQLVNLKKAIDTKDYEVASKLIDEIIEDIRNGIED